MILDEIYFYNSMQIGPSGLGPKGDVIAGMFGLG